MKINTYLLILFLFKTSICLPSAQNTQPLQSQTSFSWSCNKSITATGKKLNTEKNFGTITTIQKILTAVLQQKNETIITIGSNNDPYLKQLRIQLRDEQEGSTCLLTYTVKTTEQNEYFVHKSIWNLISEHNHNNIGVNPFTTAELSGAIINVNTDFKNRLFNILCCTSSDRLDFYPQYLLKKIEQKAQNNPNSLLTYSNSLDPRALEKINASLPMIYIPILGNQSLEQMQTFLPIYSMPPLDTQISTKNTIYDPELQNVKMNFK